MLIYILGILFLLLLLLGCPVFLCLGITSVLFLFINGELMFNIPQCIFSGLDSFPLLAIPLFIFAGNIMNRGGATVRIFRFAQTIFGHFRGGLAYVNVVASLIFAGMSGSAVADAGGLGQIEIKAMREQNYPDAFSAGITAVSCIVGPIIPPSISMVVYGVMANSSIGALFLAGFIPGLFIAISLMIKIAIISNKRGFPRTKRAKFLEIWIAFKDAFLL